MAHFGQKTSQTPNRHFSGGDKQFQSASFFTSGDKHFRSVNLFTSGDEYFQSPQHFKSLTSGHKILTFPLVAINIFKVPNMSTLIFTRGDNYSQKSPTL